MSTTIPTDPAARRALVRDLVAHAAEGLSFLGWQAAICRAYPEDRHNIGRALVVIAETRYALDLAEALSISLPVRRPQNLRARPTRRGAFSNVGIRKSGSRTKLRSLRS